MDSVIKSNFSRVVTTVRDHLIRRSVNIATPESHNRSGIVKSPTTYIINEISLTFVELFICMLREHAGYVSIAG